MVIAAIRWSLALVCLAGSNLAAQEPTKATKPLVLTIPGQILAADAKDAVRQMPCKIHIVNLEKGKSYLVDMTSSDLDSYLRIEDSQGARLNQDDDGGGNLNARIRFTPTKDDAYQIIATTFAGGEGAYTLTVKDANAPVALEKPSPKKLIPPLVRPKNKLPPAEAKGPVDDLKLQPPTDKKPVSVQGRLQDGDPLDPVRKQLAKSYAVELGEGLYTVKLSSGDFDAFLRIVDAQGNELANDDDSGGNLDARIFFVPPAKGVYRIIATSFQGGAGAFQLDIQPSSEFGRAVKYDPKKVNDVAQGFFIASGLTANDPKDAVQQQSPCQAHQVKLEKNKTYIVDLLSGQMDSFLRIEDAQKANLAEDDDGGGGLNSRLEFTPGDTGLFRLIATNLDGRAGSYVIAIRAKE